MYRYNCTDIYSVKPDLNDLGIVGQRIPNFDETLCNGCKKCKIEKVCPMKAAKVEDGILTVDQEPVSYTHLDVYKRQVL